MEVYYSLTTLLMLFIELPTEIDMMLSSKIKQQYQTVLQNCEHRLCRHPERTVAERLQSLLTLAEEYPQADIYGNGSLINDFEKQIASLIGYEDAIFLPSGTMAQVMALRIWAEQKHNNQVAFHPTSHLQLHEQNAYQQLHGLSAVLVGDPEKPVTPDDLKNINVDISALLLELPMREIGGQLPSWDELKAQSEWAHQNNVALHLDGARVWSCEPYYQKSLSEICQLFDSVYLSFYKDLDGIAGAVLAGSKAFIEEARIWSRRCGGNLISQFPDVLAAKQGFAKNLPLMSEYVSKTSKIAKYFNEHSNLQTIPEVPPCNLFHLVINHTTDELMPKVIAWSENSNIGLLPLPRALTENGSRFEITIGQNALALTDKQWQTAIANFADSIG